jgi:hypothetical protein
LYQLKDIWGRDKNEKSLQVAALTVWVTSSIL